MGRIKVEATDTDYAGNGYYKGNDGKFYYGNVKNGYLRETEGEKRKRLMRERNKEEAERESSREPSAPEAPTPSFSLDQNVKLSPFEKIAYTIIALIVIAMYTGALVLALTISVFVILPLASIWMWIQAFMSTFTFAVGSGFSSLSMILVIPLLLMAVVLLWSIVETFKSRKVPYLRIVVAYVVLSVPFAAVRCLSFDIIAKKTVFLTEGFSYQLFSVSLSMMLLPILFNMYMSKLLNKHPDITNKVERDMILKKMNKKSKKL